MGRIHDSEAARKAIESARSAGFDNFNIDLMHGLPGQTPEQALRDLEIAVSYQPTHLSWYQLTIEPNTEFFSRPPEIPDDDRLGIFTRRAPRTSTARAFAIMRSRPGACPDVRAATT